MLGGALLVVVDHPFVDDLPRLGQAAEEVGVVHFAAQAAVDALDVGVLGRLAWLDVMEGDAVTVAPGNEFVGDELGAVVDADLLGPRPAFPDLVEHADDPLGGQRGVDLNGKDFAHAFVDDVER